MTRRNWKRVQPASLRDAMDLCLEYAREKHNQSIDNIANTMGLASKWTLYKWVQEANLPSRMIRPFEHACGIHLVSRWLAVSSGKLVVDIPRGKLASPEDIHTLQEVTNDAIGALIKFYADQADTEETLAAVQNALERLAWHRANVEKCRQPELPFDDA